MASLATSQGQVRPGQVANRPPPSGPTQPALIPLLVCKLHLIHSFTCTASHSAAHTLRHLTHPMLSTMHPAYIRIRLTVKRIFRSNLLLACFLGVSAS
ncbi:hypothetical protein E2C01_032269 [Portunus trituberculatus]|uniref:Uncharacterized protein n=1 Tax=Portunus trituberculatus TaxID=210409 RepID=A0A5B7EZ81_PORTR|nr:hypothetical protein [Portunus trituberculatus]